MSKERNAVEGYLDTVKRLEPNLHMVDRDAWGTSIAISLKRIADMMQSDRDEKIKSAEVQTELFLARLRAETDELNDRLKHD